MMIMEKVQVTARDVAKMLTKKANVISSTQFKRLPSIPERSQKKSLTVPDQALSIQEILKRYASGQSLPELQDGYFDEEIPDLKNLSSLERMDLKRETAESIKQMRDDLLSAELMRKQQAETKQKEEASASEKKESQKSEDEKGESVAKAQKSEQKQ